MRSYQYLSKAALAIAILAIVSSFARAGNIAYATAEPSSGQYILYQVDLTAATATEIGSLGVLMEGLATSVSGKLYGTDGGGGLYLINPNTAKTTLIGSTARGDIEGLDYDRTTLLGTDFGNPPTIFTINPSNGETRNFLTATAPTGVVRAMCVEDESHVLVVGDGPPAHTLYSIDLRSGEVVTIGTLSISASAEMPALDFVNGVLYGLDTSGNEWTIDPSNGAVTLVGNTGNQLWLDMKAIPPQ